MPCSPSGENCSKSIPRNCGKEGLASPQGLGSRRQVSPSPPAGKQAPERRQACAQFPWCISSGRSWQSSLFATRGGPRDLQNWSHASEVSLAKEIGTWLSESHPDFMPCSTGYSLQVWEEGQAGWLRWELESPSGQVMACTWGLGEDSSYTVQSPRKLDHFQVVHQAYAPHLSPLYYKSDWQRHLSS